MHLEYKITVKENGRLVLPIKIREQLGITKGDQLLFILDKELKVVPLKTSLKQFQERIKNVNKKHISLVDSLKETRKMEKDLDE